MSNAYFSQTDRINVSTRDRNAALASLRLPPGDWVIFVKFDVAVSAGPDTDLRPRISNFRLEFGGKKDAAVCHLNQGGLDTVVLNLAASHSASSTVLGGGGLLYAKAVLICESTNDDFELRRLAMTAISVDSIN